MNWLFELDLKFLFFFFFLDLKFQLGTHHIRSTGRSAFLQQDLHNVEMTHK